MPEKKVNLLIIRQSHVQSVIGKIVEKVGIKRFFPCEFLSSSLLDPFT